MGLRINTNTAAINVTRQLNRSTGSMGTSLERLSSGLRINRAADDAAGLAIAEELRSQVRGLRIAQRNVQDGVSMVQTAEGALSETQNMLQRMRELAVQAVARSSRRDDFQLLDQSVHIERLSLSRDRSGRWRIWRQYRFDYTYDGVERRQGRVIMLGKQLQAVVVSDPAHTLH